MSKINKDELVSLDNTFKILKETPQNKAALEMLESFAEKIFSYKFHVNISFISDRSEPLFIMSVFPDQSTIDKIITCVTNNDSKSLETLWKQTKEWTVEIDSRILTDEIVDLTDRELTAIFCHEIGHIINSNTIPSRLLVILQYQIAKYSMSNKVLLKDKFFKKILSLPIVNACMGGSKRDSLKEEIKADKFVKQMGYQSDLISVMQKFQKSSKAFKGDTPDKAMKMMGAFTQDALNQFKVRETSLLESTLLKFKESCESQYVESVIDEIYDTFFSESMESSVTKEKKLDFFYERADKLEDEFIANEFFILGKKNLKRIDPSEIDFIIIKIKSIKDNTDKMMLVSYIHSKLDIVNYYIALLNNPKQSKKYNIPYTMDELIGLKNQLDKLLQDTINAKLPGKLGMNVLIAWPDGYEG